MYDFVLERRSELRPNCELPHHQGLRVLTFPSVDSKLSLPIMLRAQTLTFDEHAPVSIKVPHERTLIILKAIFWAEQPAEIIGVGTLHVVQSLTYFIAEGEPVREFRAALPRFRRLLLRCNLGKVRLEGVETRVKSFLRGGKVPFLLLPCPTRELLSMRLAQTLISLASEKEHLLVVLRRQLASPQAWENAPVDEVHARSVVSSSTALAAFVVPLYDLLLEFRTLHPELPKFLGRGQLQVTGRVGGRAIEATSRVSGCANGRAVGGCTRVGACGGRALNLAGGAVKQHVRVLSARLADSCDGFVIVQAPCLPILREAGCIVVACAVSICENLAYEVDHHAQGVRFCPRFCVGCVRA